MNNLAGDIREMLREQVQYRGLLYEMTKRDLLLRYKQTVMGFGWAIFSPLVNTIVFTVIFAEVAQIKTPVAYPVWVYCGLLAWNFTQATLRSAVTSLTSNGGLVTKIFFPREILPFSAITVALVDLAVGSSVLIILMLWFRVPASPYILVLPVVIFVHVVFTAAVSLLLAMANLFYRDVKYLFEVVITVWLFATAILYPLDSLSPRLRTLVSLNPMTPIIEAYRDAILGTGVPDFASIATVGAISLLALVAAWVQFHRSELEFAERI
jgi:lipopolysaccharide transport system permease protein